MPKHPSTVSEFDQLLVRHEHGTFSRAFPDGIPRMRAGDIVAFLAANAPAFVEPDWMALADEVDDAVRHFAGHFGNTDPLVERGDGFWLTEVQTYGAMIALLNGGPDGWDPNTHAALEAIIKAFVAERRSQTARLQLVDEASSKSLSVSITERGLISLIVEAGTTKRTRNDGITLDGSVAETLRAVHAMFDHADSDQRTKSAS